MYPDTGSKSIGGCFFMANKNKNSNKKAEVITFGIAAVALSSIFGFGLGGIIAGVALGFGIGKVIGIMASPLDTTTHNKEDEARRMQEEEERKQQELIRSMQKEAEEQRRSEEDAQRIPRSGDPAADAIINKGEEMLRIIRDENIAIPDSTLTGQMNTLSEKCRQIFITLSEEPAKAPQVRKFMNYYLPTTLKMLANFRTMQNRGVSVSELEEARTTTVRGMNMILTACQKQLDNLHKENMLDISTDIDVLEQMLRRDGYLEDELTGEKGLVTAARTAAEEQIRSGTPVLDFAGIASDESDSFQNRKNRSEF